MNRLLTPDQDSIPVFGSVTGIDLPGPFFSVCDGVELRAGVFDVFSSPMLAFAAPASEGQHTPRTWVAVHGGFTFKSRVELAIKNMRSFADLLPSQATWTVAALVRLRIEVPVRISALANIPLATLPEYRTATAVAFEGFPFQTGVFRTGMHRLGTDDIEWLSSTLPIVRELLRCDRFYRAFTLYDSAFWSNRVELSVTILWTA